MVIRTKSRAKKTQQLISVAAILPSWYMQTADDLFGGPQGGPRTDELIGAGLGFVLMGAFLTAMATAQCGTPTAKLHKQAWRVGDPAALLTQDADTEEPIVGMWHVMFTAEGNSEGPPNGTPIENAIVVLHNDHTEIMNSGRPPQDGDFCMGVWKKAGRSKYKLNHFAWGLNDTTNAPSGIGNPMGPTRIVEAVTLSPDGNHYVGTFTLDGTPIPQETPRSTSSV